jgi:geranylgeranyl pyrophosphate synthase
LGLNEAREKAGELREAALTSLSVFHSEADPLRWLAEFITSRDQ